MSTRSGETERGDDKPPGWRVEGMPDKQADAPRRSGGPGLPGGPWIWLVALALLVANWILFNVVAAPDERISISYTAFLDEVDRGNVASVNSTDQTIQGEFREGVASPEDPDRTATLFETERPTFADDDLFLILRDAGVEISAENPEAPPALWQQLLFGFGPTILLGLCWYRCTSWGALSGMLAGAATTFIWGLTPQLKAIVHQIVPAFFASLIATIVISLMSSQKNHPD